MSEPIQGVEDALDRLEQAVASSSDAGTGKVSVATVLDAFGRRSYGPLLLVPALIELTPIGSIPGVPTLIAFLILTTALQILAGRDHVWVPGFIERQRLRGDWIEAADSKIRPVARWLDRHTKARFRPLVRNPAVKLAAFLIVCLCLTVPPLELVPFASSIPMATVALFGLALLVGDGLLMLIAFLGVAAAVGGIIAMV
ncbi:exopolysaccharide biosynthesis protein [Parvularcula lutaonensis]|uniref:Exopolysaccharide biosynthesis protein n=1 Tax=Parvularcula lutaonensis TaxID=491923 RepID=A0ABV7MC14_9PROT|nr:exopolysaccharide biosynthesis protein [Parvularcula lutaonensis]GGY36597.1 membrane protein [Parvularcula lutaonensis]